MDYISISEFAALAGVSRQAIYNRLDKDLQKFVKQVDKRKMLSTKAVELFSEGKNCQDAVNNSVNPLQDVVNVLTEQLRVKDEQLSAKDEQIKSLLAAIEHANEMHEHTQVLLRQQQQLALPLRDEQRGILTRIFKKSKKSETDD